MRPRKKAEIEAYYRTLTEAQLKILIALHSFDSEQRTRIINAALILLGGK